MPPRITHCPETGRPLDGLDIRAHAEHLWPGKTPERMMSKEALERKAALLIEAAARDDDAKSERKPR